MQLPVRDRDWRPIAGSEHASTALLTPLQVVRLGKDHAALLTQAVEVVNGLPQNGHPSGAWLGAYFFSRDSEGWALVSRIDGFDYQGFFGLVGASGVTRIAPHRFALTLQNGSCWQGFCGTWLSIYEIGAGSVQTLVKGVPLEASNQNASEACGDVLAGKPSIEKIGYACFDVAGKYSIALGSDESPGELRIAFTGRSQANPDAPLKPVKETQVYQYQPQGYKLISGRNPVPGF